MDLDFAEEQEMLRETVRKVCSEQAPVAVVRAMEDDPTGYPAGLWTQLGALGLTGLLLPEEYGGAGQSMIEGAILYEELGRALAPSPHFPSAVMGGGVLLHAGSREQQQRWLPEIASGSAVFTPAWLEPRGGFGPRGVQLAAKTEGSLVRLTGTKHLVPFARAATRLLVLARTGPGDTDIDLFLVDPSAPGVEIMPEYSLAADALFKIAFNDVRVPAADRVGASHAGWAAWDAVMHDGLILLAAQAMGGAERAVEITVEYAKVRHQFDKPLGAFQAIAHYLADATTLVDGGKTLAYEAAWARANGRSVRRLAPMAKLFAGQTYRDVTATCVQIHGGYGFTVEYDIQLYFRRAKQLQLSWWDTRYLEELIATDVLDERAAPPA
jgi:alkylation response protein AidB-like acyl-CoA dehydrogenase